MAKSKKPTKKELEEGLRKYEDLFQNMYDALLILGMDGYIKESNKAAQKLIGFSEEEIKTIHITKIVHPDDAENSKKYFEQLLAEGFYSDYEGRIISKTGEVKIVQVNSSAIYDDEGNIIGSRDLIRDVTERRRAQQEIIAQENRFKSIFFNASIGIVINDLAGNFISVNPAFETMLGYKEGGLSSKTIAAITFEEDIAATKAAFQEALDSKTFKFSIEKRYKKKDGTLLWGRTHVTINEVEKGTLNTIALIENINEQIEANERIKHNERKLKKIIDTALDAVINIDERGHVIEWNSNSEHIFGYTSEEVMGKNMGDFIVPARFRSGHDNGMKHFLKTGEGPVLGRRIEIIGQHKEGHEFPIELAVSPIIIDGKYIFNAFIRDISDRVNAEKKLKELVEELSKANQELKDFAYVVSHDLKAPLRAIGSLSNWLYEDNKDKLDKDSVEQLELIQTRVKRMHNFIEGILHYSRIGRTKNEKETVDLDNLVRVINESLSTDDSSELNIVQPLPSIVCEKIRLEQVFQNLISNAIKYSDKPKCIISITWSENETHYLFQVKDNGPGIDAKYHNKIFQIFQTLNPRDQVESTGIGLTIVKRIIETHEGEIGIQSEEGKGASFNFSIKKY